MRAIKIKIKNIVILIFSLFLTLAVFSQITLTTKTSAAKPTTVVGLNKADWLYYKSNNDLTAYLGKKSSTLPTVRYQKNNDYLEFSLNNVSSTTSVSLETNTKTPNTPTLFYRNVFSDTDVTYQITNIPFKVKEEIVLKKFLISNFQFPINDSISNDLNSKQKPTTYHLPPTTFLFSAETTGKPVKQKDGSIAFFDENNNYLFNLEKPFMVDAKGTRSEEVSLEIKPVQTKIASEETIFGDSNLERKRGLPPDTNQYIGTKNFVNTLNKYIVDIKNVLDLGGIEPPKSLVATRDSLQARPRTKLFYHKENLNPVEYQITLSASSEWLSTAAYPVVIDPTVAHNADSNFTGQFNRVADSDTTSSTQLESSYPEASKDPYTVLLLHFNEANGATAGITDMASTTRVITANGNASTTSAVKQLGLGNSAAFDGTGDYLSVPDSEDWNFGTGDFTIDGWIRSTNTNSNILFVRRVNAGSYGYIFSIYQSKLNAVISFDGTSWGINVQVGTIKLNTWQHVAIVRNGTAFYGFIDGIKYDIATNAGTIYNSNTAPFIGADVDGNNGLIGSLDEFRIIKGRALTAEEIKAAASRRPYAVYTSPVIDATASVAWNTLNWTEGGVNTGNGEQPYNTNSLVAQWDFNDTSGTTLTASSSGSCTTACNGTLNGFSYTASQDQATTTTGWTANNKRWGAGALMFDGTNDYVGKDSGVSGFGGTNGMTLETWVNRNSDTLGTVLAGGDTSSYQYFRLSLNYNSVAGSVRADFGNDANNDYSIKYTTANSVSSGNWHHLVATYNAGAVKIYVDGIEMSGTTAGTWTGNVVTPTTYLRIGNQYSGSNSSYFSGILDSARIYNRALSASEILSNYNAGNIEIQTRTGATSDPNDGSWEAWKPTTAETQLLSLDSDAVNWHSDIMASTTIATSTESTIKMEGTGSLKIETGKASTTAGTVALWHFEETGTTTGGTLYDSSANARNLTTTGTLPSDGIFGKARRFNGTSDYATVSSSGFPTGGASRTIMAWARHDDNATTGYVFGYGTGVAGHLFGISNSGGNWFFQGYAAGDLATGVALVPNKWHHVAVSYDGTTVRFYLNGLEIANGAKTLSTDGTVFHIGDSESDSASKWKGLVDEMAVYSRVLSADEIAETYRMGANHHLTREVSATDLSGANKLAFNVAADRPGTYLEAMLGESDYANYELASSTVALSANTVLYIKGDEIASSTSIKDSSFSGKTITANGDAKTAGGGKIGNAVAFDGTGDYLSLADSDDWAFGTGDFSIDTWLKYNSVSGDLGIYGHGPSNGFLIYSRSSDSTVNAVVDAGATLVFAATWAPVTNTWYHLALTRSGNNWSWFVNGSKIGGTSNPSTIGNYTGTANIGSAPGGGGNYFNGSLDEVRIIKGTALTPDQIRQAYEYGLRTHPITIDFGASLQPSDLISSATDYNFSITATTSGASATTTGLYLGDKIIIKENLGGTEYSAQGTVNAINTTTGAITVPSWDSGSTFPSGNGYSPGATVFKWQREYFDITGAATTTRDAITNLTLRPTNGAEGRTIYLDDFRYNTNYLTASSSSAITSGNNRYLQYRAIFTSTDTFVSPFLTAFNTLYTSLATMFPSLIGVSGGGFLSF